MGGYRTYKELDVWIKSRVLVKEIYLITLSLPKEELYGIVSQMRRSAVSIPSNIAEGYGRQHKKETVQFLHIARGSLYELETQLYIATDLHFIDETKMNKTILMIEENRKLLNGLIKYFENSTILK
jgi:four helix bundle protein